MSEKHHKLIVLGSGPAGYTAAILRGSRKFKACCHHWHANGRSIDNNHRS